MTATLPKIAIKTGTWTIENTTTGEHRTFRISRSKPEGHKFEGKRFVELLTGPCNVGDYRAFGFASDDTIAVWRKNRGERGAPSAFDYYASMIASLMGGRAFVRVDWAARGYELRGEARCCRCGRALTTPESLDAGIGPICAGR